MRAARRVAITLAAVITTWYATAATPRNEERAGTLEETVNEAPHHVTYVAENGNSLGNLEFLDKVIKESKERGLYDRLESFLQEKYGRAPREQYRIGHDSLEEAIVAYTDNERTIGIGPKFEESSREIASRYGITPALAAFLTYGHERAHMAQGKGRQRTRKQAEMDVDSTMEEFLLKEASLAKQEGRLIEANHFRNAAEYQHNRVQAVRNDLIPRYREAA